MDLLKLKKLSLPRYGECVIEDFVPISKERVLVTAGPDLRRLRAIVETDWDLGNPKVLVWGCYLRLGHFTDHLVYSEGWETPHQPFEHETGRYYTNDAPEGRLYKDEKLLIDHWFGVAEVGNPWISGDTLYFEARDSRIDDPTGWWIYSSTLEGKNIRKLIQGANPCVFEGNLYYGIWNGTGFDIAREDRLDLLPTDAYI